MEPGRIDLSFFVAESHRKLGNLDAAAAGAREVTDFDPKIASAWATRAMAAEQAGNLTEASGLFSTALNLFPAGRLPRILFSEFLKRHPEQAKEVGREDWRPTDRSAQPEALLSANMDSFQLLD